MTVTRVEVDALMKRCQTGVGGKQALNNAHSIMAECYGTLGALMTQVETLRSVLADVSDWDVQGTKLSDAWDECEDDPGAWARLLDGTPPTGAARAGRQKNPVPDAGPPPPRVNSELRPLTDPDILAIVQQPDCAEAAANGNLIGMAQAVARAVERRYIGVTE